LPRSAGHRAGPKQPGESSEAAPSFGIHTLTLFALSSANWKRPTAEVQAILRLLHEYLLTETTHCIDEGVRLSISGAGIASPPRFASHRGFGSRHGKGTRMHLRLAVDYPPAKPSITPPAAFTKSPSFLPILQQRACGSPPRGLDGSRLLIRTGVNSGFPISLVGMRIRRNRIS